VEADSEGMAEVTTAQINPQLIPLAFALDRLVPDPANARTHDQRNIDAIKASLVMFGQRKPIVATDAGVVIAGNGTMQAAKELGWDKIAVVFVKDDSAMAAAYAIADNRTAELAKWNDDILGTILGGLADTPINMADLGFTKQELANLIGDIETPPGTADDQGKLDETNPTVCPKCGHSWHP
jgi:ParB-like chromosome segregation protein Spo0J